MSMNMELLKLETYRHRIPGSIPWLNQTKDFKSLYSQLFCLTFSMKKG